MGSENGTLQQSLYSGKVGDPRSPDVCPVCLVSSMRCQNHSDSQSLIIQE